jgi:hypothetical protein
VHNSPIHHADPTGLGEEEEYWRGIIEYTFPSFYKFITDFEQDEYIRDEETEHQVLVPPVDTPGLTTEELSRVLASQEVLPYNYCIACIMAPEARLEHSFFIRAYAYREKELLSVVNPIDLLPQHPRGPKFSKMPPIGGAKIKVPLFGVKHTFNFSETSDLANPEYNVRYYSVEDTYVSAKVATPRFGEIELRTYPLSGLPEEEFDPLRKGKLLWNPLSFKRKPKLNLLKNEIVLESKAQFTFDWADEGLYAAPGFRGVLEYKGLYGYGVEASAGVTFDMGVLPGESYCRNMCHFRQMEEAPELQIHWPYPIPELWSWLWY